MIVLEAVLLEAWDPVFVIVCSAVIVGVAVAVCDLVFDGVTVPDPVGNCDPERVCVSVGVPVLEGVPEPVPVPVPDTDPDPDLLPVCDPDPVLVPVPVETPVWLPVRVTVWVPDSEPVCV